MATVVSESNPSRPLVDKGKDDDDDENATGSSTMVFNAKLEILAEQPLTKATGKDPQDQQEFDEESMVWTEALLERLRLCHNRAYQKANSKRRQHLPASLSAIMLKDWQSFRPGDKFSASYLLRAYRERFHPTSAAYWSSSGRKRISSSRREGVKTSRSSPSSSNSHSEKQWSDQMLDTLTRCGERASQRQAVQSEDFATLLHREWLKCYPNSSLSARHLKSRLNVYQRTRSEAPPASKRRKVGDYRAADDDPSCDDAHRKPSTLSCNDADEVSGGTVADTVLSSPETGTGDENASQDTAIAKGNWACVKHRLHVFKDCDVSVECSLTEDLLQVREKLKSTFPGCDLHHVKKPKGFSVQALREWKLVHPEMTSENIKSISVRFSKYDKAHSHLDGSRRRFVNGRIEWSPDLLDNLVKTRRIAEKKAGVSASSNMVTRKWKQQWYKIYPKFQGEWSEVVTAFRNHVESNGGDLTQGTSSSSGLWVSDLSIDLTQADEKVKGFRKWTPKMLDDLVDTYKATLADNPYMEEGSSEFNRVLLHNFHQLYPKCMESTRSIYSKLLQFLEKKGERNNVKSAVVTKEEAKVVEVKKEVEHIEEQEPKKESSDDNPELKSAADVKEEAPEPDDQGNGEAVPETQQESQQHTEPSPDHSAAVEVKVEEIDHRKKERETIEGFDTWSLVMIRDFIACMDSTRRKFATLKEKNPDGNIKLVPLLLDEWRRLYADTQETVKSFLVKIKYLKQQKDLIKAKLGQAGLLPKIDAGGDGDVKKVRDSDCDSDPSHKKRMKPVKVTSPAVVQNDGEFRWQKEMITDVIQTRKKALELKEEGHRKGKKLSFHQLWAQEFRKIYPNSPYSSNNLSVHLWTWRKQQQKLGKMDPLYDKAYSLADTSRPPHNQNQRDFRRRQNHVSGVTLGPRLRRDLLAAGKKVEDVLSDNETPNELKVKGFPALLWDEWRRMHPERKDTLRGLNFMYSKLTREISTGPPDTTTAPGEKRPLWNPKLNIIMRQNLERNLGRCSSKGELIDRVLADWRQQVDKKTSSQMSDEFLRRKLKDLMTMRKASKKSSRHSSSRSCEICWDAQTLRNLLDCYRRVTDKTEPRLQSAATLFHDEFRRLHPTIADKMSLGVLLAKLFCFREDLLQGRQTLNGTKEMLPPPIKEDETVPSVSVKGEAKLPPATTGAPVPGRDIVFRTWSKEMIDNLMKTKKVALAKKRDMALNGRTDVQLVDLWYEEFIGLHPEYSSTKKNLMQKYKWYRSRLKKLDREEAKPNSASIDLSKLMPKNSDPMPKIRKDLYLHIKALMEESKIYLPSKLPEDPELMSSAVPCSLTIPLGAPGASSPGAAIIRPVYVAPPTAIVLPVSEAAAGLVGGNPSASPALAQLHQQTARHDAFSTSNPAHFLPSNQNALQLANVALPTHIKAHSQEEHPTDDAGEEEAEDEYEGSKKDAIKLPGGATLVAVTERNADSISKPKPVEKPHVTITIGDKSKTHQQQQQGVQDHPVFSGSSSSSTPPPLKQPVVLPINIPKFPLAASTPPPLPQLKPYGMDLTKKLQMKPLDIRPAPPAFTITPKAIFIPPRVKVRLDEVGLTDVQFIHLLQVYEKARDEYVDVLKRGFLAFFPFILGNRWKTSQPQIPLTGRKLSSIVDLYIEEKNKGQHAKAATPEFLTKKPCHFSVTEDLLRQVLILHDEVVQSMDNNEAKVVNLAEANVEMCRRWSENRPDVKMTTKQLISIHEMLTYDSKSKKCASPEIEYVLADIWKHLETSVLSQPDDDGSTSQEPEDKTDLNLDADDDISLEQMQLWLLSTQFLRSTSQPIRRRPRFVAQNLRRFWTLDRIGSLEICKQRAALRFMCSKGHRRSSLASLMFAQWQALHPDLKLTKNQVISKAVRQIRYEKRKKALAMEKIFDTWRDTCHDLASSAELTYVVEEPSKDILSESGLSRLTSTSDDDDHDDRDDSDADDDDGNEILLAHLAKLQRQRGTNHSLTWTPDVVGDLLQARDNARHRKKEWEDEYGGVVRPSDMAHVKLDDLFKEEWAKLRPELASLSIWTLQAYSRKYDNIKKQLMQERISKRKKRADLEQRERAKAVSDSKAWQTLVFFENSSIPKFDLDELRNLPEEFSEMRDLLITRQLAKTRQEEEKSKLNLQSLWLEEWLKLRPEEQEKHKERRLNGYHLQIRLYHLERLPYSLDVIRSALITRRPEDVKSNRKRPSLMDDLDAPQLMPRSSIFPEGEAQSSFNVYGYVNFRDPAKKSSHTDGHSDRRILLQLHPDIYSMTKKKLLLPAVEKVDEELIEEEDDDDMEELIDPAEWQERHSRHVAASPSTASMVTTEELKQFLRQDPDQDTTTFDNINNHLYVLSILKAPRIPRKCPVANEEVVDEDDPSYDEDEDEDMDDVYEDLATPRKD